MFGIYRGPDPRPPEVKAAAARISMGRNVAGLTSFRCDECDQYGMIEIDHKPDCDTGRILNEWLKSRGWD